MNYWIFIQCLQKFQIAAFIDLEIIKIFHIITKHKTFENMNKDDHCSLSLGDRFNLYLSDPAIDRELMQVRRPIISVESLP